MSERRKFDIGPWGRQPVTLPDQRRSVPRRGGERRVDFHPHVANLPTPLGRVHIFRGTDRRAPSEEETP